MYSGVLVNKRKKIGACHWGCVNNSGVNWLGDTVTGVDGASHHAPSIN